MVGIIPCQSSSTRVSLWLTISPMSQVSPFGGLFVKDVAIKNLIPASHTGSKHLGSSLRSPATPHFSGGHTPHAFWLSFCVHPEEPPTADFFRNPTAALPPFRRFAGSASHVGSWRAKQTRLWTPIVHFLFDPQNSA